MKHVFYLLVILIVGIVGCYSSAGATSLSDTSKLKSFTGNGDDVVILDLDDYDDLYVFEISGNKADGYFGVKSYSSSGKYLDLLVNTTDPYYGIVAGGFEKAAYLEVNATGKWDISIIPIASLDVAYSGTTMSGSGDMVFLYSNIQGTSMVAEINGNKSDGYFGVKSYSLSGDYLSLLVNTAEPYSGKVLLKRNPEVFIIRAEPSDPWTIKFN